MWVNKLYQKSGKRKYEMSEWKYNHIWNCHKYQIKVRIFTVSIYEKTKEMGVRNQKEP